MKILQQDFFEQDALIVAKKLLGKHLYKKTANSYLHLQIVETEAYLLEDKASHSFKGEKASNRAMFAEPGTLYLYYARGKDSLNVRAGKRGDGVLIKAAIIPDDLNENSSLFELLFMRLGRPSKPKSRLVSGQTFICKALHITVPEWNGKKFDPELLFIADIGYTPQKIILAKRLGISMGRDEHLLYRFVDYEYRDSATLNPIRRTTQEGIDYIVQNFY